MHEPIKVLDHGYVRFVEAWGHGDAGCVSSPADVCETGSEDMECGIIEAARQSTQGSFRGWDREDKLNKYLFTEEPQHSTPYEFAGMIVELEAPIIVVRELQRHRTISVTDDCFSGDFAFNEMSGRYAAIPCKDYLPEKDRCFRVDLKNKQSTGIEGVQLQETECIDWIQELKELQEHSERVYQKGLRIGIPKELTRGALTVFRYSRMRVTGYLRNWLAFSTLRNHPKAQEEIRDYAKAIDSILSNQFPRTYSLFLQRKNG